MSKFQIILLAFFAVFIVAGVAVFALYRGSGEGDISVTVWGDIPSEAFHRLLNTPAIDHNLAVSTVYEEKPRETIEAEFTEALARGKGPDLIIISQDQIWSYKAKLMLIPYTSISERDFKSAFIDEGELFLAPEGIYALPLTVDPLVLYYNRDLLASTGESQPMRYWDEIYGAATNYSKMDSLGNLVSSVMALGESFNIPHAKDIVSLLMLQAGTPITSLKGSELSARISDSLGQTVMPAESALNFYTQFSNPAKVFYSWNRSLIDAQTHFTSGDSAYYLGFASEFSVIKNMNPNLNFGVTLVPQSRVSGKILTFANMRGVAISRGSKNVSQAFSLLTALVSSDSSLSLAQILLLPPSRRGLLSQKPADNAVFSVFYDAATQSRGWLDPDREATKAVFGEMVESVTSGRAQVLDVLRKANREIDNLIKQQ